VLRRASNGAAAIVAADTVDPNPPARSPRRHWQPSIDSGILAVQGGGAPMHYDLRRPRGAVLLCLTFITLMCAGCIPEEQWLDDSSGFVYSFAKDDKTLEIRFYDIAQRADRIVWSGSNRSGHCLDSETNVLSIIESEPKNGQLSTSFRFSSHDLKTNRLSRTTGWMNWDRIKPDSGLLFLLKVPNKPSHFLVMADGSEGSFRHAILNVDAETILDIPDVILMPAPDGSGFLARSLSAMKTWQGSLKGMNKLESHAIKKLCEESLSFVDLGGKQFQLTWDESSLTRAFAHYEKQWKNAATNARPGNATYEDLFLIQWQDWLGNGSQKQKPMDTMTVLLGDERGVLQVDVKQRTVRELVGPVAPNADVSPAFSVGTAIALELPVKLKNVQYRTRVLEHGTRKAPYFVVNVEARWPIERKARTLLNRIKVYALPRCDKASPNGLFAVLKYEEPKDEKNKKRSRIHYVIVDHAGNLVDSLFFEHLDTNEIGIVMPWLPNNEPKKQK
jgi:hypothetical protein